MKNHLRNLQSEVAFCLCRVAVRKRIYGLRQTQNAASGGIKAFLIEFDY